MDEHDAQVAKRRRLRKGTHSCWECKRRKMKCVFEGSAICRNCHRRGSRCVTQEFDVDADTGAIAAASYATPDDDDGDDGRRASHGIPTPSSLEPGLPDRDSSLSGYGSLSRFLYASLPLRDDIDRIVKADRHPSILPYETMTVPYAELQQTGPSTLDGISRTLTPNTHPVLLAKHMLLIATVLQNLRPDCQREIRGLTEAPHAIMERLADLAMRHVTSNEALTGSIEGLECVIIESVHQANLGNLRRSWLACRRAMTIAQLMGLNHSNQKASHQVLEPGSKHFPQLMWYRIVSLDRFLCLMLGLSQGSHDRSMASEQMLANETPIGRIERIHCVVASRILERNEERSTTLDFALTRTLDEELQRAARSLPGKWWLAPATNVESADPSSVFWDIRRLFAQMMHYNLLNQLHLPFLLRPASDDRQHAYSRITCINASREILSRVINLRSFNGTSYSCRIADFLVLMAALTLLLAHHASHQAGAQELVAHQYHTDRAMIEQVQEIMEEVHRVHADPVSAQSADLLKTLLTAGTNSQDGQAQDNLRVSLQGPESESSTMDGNGTVRVHIPYFGTIQIAPDSISKQGLGTHAQIATSYNQHVNPPSGPAAIASAPVGPSTQIQRNGELMRPFGFDTASTTNLYSAVPPLAPAFQDDLLNVPLDHDMWPGLAAGADDWALQGTDTAFFDMLMRGHEEPNVPLTKGWEASS